MYAFEYHRPSSVKEAVKLLGSAEDPKIIAGGQSLIPMMKQRLAAPETLIDIRGLEELKGIEASARNLVIGGGVTHGEVASSQTVKDTIPGLWDMAKVIGDPHVRHLGTLGGSVANNDPAADYPAALVALEATIITNTRKIPAEEFFVDMFETVLEEDEIVTKVSFPIPKRAAYAKFRNPASRYALTGVFVAKRTSGIRVAVVGAKPSVFRVPEMEEALKARFASKSLNGVTVAPDDLSSDLHASAEYRAHLVNVMARRAVERALELKET